MSRYTEPQINNALASALRGKHPDWTEENIFSERTGVLYESEAFQPDIVFCPLSQRPIIIEAEVEPGHTVDQDAVRRIGTHLGKSAECIERVVSVVYPASLRQSKLSDIEDIHIKFALHSQARDGGISRWPLNNYITGTIDDLASVLAYSSISESTLAEVSEKLNSIVTHAAGKILLSGNQAQKKIGDVLHQESCDQTNKMACAIIVSAMVFHLAIEGHQEEIPSVPRADQVTRDKMIVVWEKILSINYYPIFHIALDVLCAIPIRVATDLLAFLSREVEYLSRIGMSTYQGLCGRMFQHLIVDRKLLATFYTTPASASLLSEIAVNRLHANWSSETSILSLRIGDFACGTGALLSAVQSSIYDRFRLSGGNDREIHKRVMETVLTGLDIMPAATHLTAATLSSAHPQVGYHQSNIVTMPFGERDGGGVSIGSLDFLRGEMQGCLFGDRMSVIQSQGEIKDGFNLQEDSFDLVIMNPPFTRNVGQEAEKIGIPRPAYAGFNTLEEAQALMAKEVSKYKRQASNGMAGPATDFIDLADSRIKHGGGVIALILPFTFTCGASWSKARNLLKTKYKNIHVIAIAHEKEEERSFSTSTGMAECLVIATKRTQREINDTKAHHTESTNTEALHNIAVTTLKKRPGSVQESILMARTETLPIVTCEVKDVIKEAGVVSSSVIEYGHDVGNGAICLPGSVYKWPIHVTPLNTLATIGEYHTRFMPGYKQADPVFRTEKHKNGGAIPEYPCLWAHSCKTQTRLIVDIDRSMHILEGQREKALEVWQKKASRLMSNVEFRVNSQKFSMCRTQEKALGGRAWKNVICHDVAHDIPLLLWSNTTLGLLNFWCHGVRTQIGRSTVTISRLGTLPVLDCNHLTIDQIAECELIFSEISNSKFLPANECYRDPERKNLDERLLCGVLNLHDKVTDQGRSVFLDSLQKLRESWCNEPSVHGGKRTRPGVDNHMNIAHKST